MEIKQLGHNYYEIDGVCWYTSNPESITPQFVQVYNALRNAAERIAKANYDSQFTAHEKARRSPKTFKFYVTEAHQKVVDALNDLCKDKITPEQAMAVLHEYDVFQERTV